MLELIDQIKLSQSKKIVLFFEKNQIGEELKNNLVSISATGVAIDQNARKLLIDALFETIDKIEKDLKVFYPRRCVIFYLWFDEGEEVLRWSVVSDLNQLSLPFSSNVKEVSINKVVENWLAPKNVSDQSSPSEIDNMTPIELRTLMNSLEVPSLDVFIHRSKGSRITRNETNGVRHD